MLQRILGNLGHALGNILGIIWPPIAEMIGWIFFWDGSYVTTRLLIRNHAIPFYDKLESEYGAKYPTLMVNPRSNAFKELLPYKERDSTFYFFIKDSSFVIVRETDPNFRIEIPFSDVLCQWCTYDRTSNSVVYFSIDFHFSYNSKIEQLCFDTIKCSYRLDQKYENRLSGEKLFEFIRDTFIHENDYKKTHGYDSLP